MSLSDYIVLGVFVLIVGLVVFYIIKEKKKGTVCIGCPHAGSCPKNQKGCSCNRPK